MAIIGNNIVKEIFIISCIFSILLSACSSSNATTPVPTPTQTPNAIPTIAITASPEPTGTPTITPLPPTPTLVSESAFIKGITLNNFGPRLDTTYAQEIIKQYIIPAGANYVALIPSCWSVDMRDTTIVCSDIYIEGGLPPLTDSELINAIHYLHSVGLRVIVKPQALIQTIHISNSERKGRNFNKSQWDAWFKSYTEFIVHYAIIAEENGVDLFVIGNEQEENTDREKDWREVIAAVRAVYHGPITYAANAWGFEASRIKFWDALDYIGTNGYWFGFVNKKDPTTEDMINAWQPFVLQLEKMSSQFQKQVIITEIGARSVQGFNQGGLHDKQSPPYDGQEQADFYTAFFEALMGKPWLKGIVLWETDTSPSQGGPNDIGYTFIDKPAQKIVHQYFDGLEIVPTQTFTSDFVEDPLNTMWIYRDSLTNGWWMWSAGGSEPLSDVSAPTGYQSNHSIRVPLSKMETLFLVRDSTSLNISKYKWIEFFIMVGNNQPENLSVTLQDWSPGAPYYRNALVKDSRYIEGGEFQPGIWQRVRIPLVDLGITNVRFETTSVFIIHNCLGFQCGSDSIADDIYIDNILLVAGK